MRKEAALSSHRIADTYRRVHESFLKEDYKESARLAREYVSRWPRDREVPQVLHLEALSLAKSGDPAALERLRELEASGAPRGFQAAAALSRGDLYRHNGAWQAAYQAYEEFLWKYPRDGSAPYVLQKLSEIARKLGRGVEAERYRSRLLNEYPESPQAGAALPRS